MLADAFYNMLGNTLWDLDKKQYQVYIKSHTDCPDYEDTCEAGSLDEAIKIFLKRMGEDWTFDMIKDNVINLYK